jgi:hypothetical protein
MNASEENDNQHHRSVILDPNQIRSDEYPSPPTEKDLKNIKNGNNQNGQNQIRK